MSVLRTLILTFCTLALVSYQAACACTHHEVLAASAPVEMGHEHHCDDSAPAPHHQGKTFHKVFQPYLISRVFARKVRKISEDTYWPRNFLPRLLLQRFSLFQPALKETPWHLKATQRTLKPA